MPDHAAAMYGFCGAFFEELKAAGVTRAVVSPGARSTPLVVSADRAGLDLWVQIDERVGGFFALGMAKAGRDPVTLICTSGTAAANYLPAVVEANRAGVPLIVVTADRPPELRGWGSNQTIDQVRLYGTNTRWFAELPVASEAAPETARRYAARAAAAARSTPAGPVHLNFPLRAPLRPDDSAVPAGATADRPIAVHAAPEPGDDDVAAVVDFLSYHRRGVILGGAMAPGSIDVNAVLDVAARAGWPVLAEPTSQLRVASDDGVVVATAGHLVQHRGFADSHRPEAVLLLGAAPPQRALQNWLREGEGCPVMIVGNGDEWLDESHTFTDAVRADPMRLFSRVSTMPACEVDDDWVSSWREADATAARAIASALIESPMFEGRVVTAIAGALPDEAALFVGNSMAVRDVNLFWPARDLPLPIYSNRGASGIDGVVSSGAGVAATTGEPVVIFLGDLSLLHDLGGLLAAVRLRLPVVVVVVNNDGGGIFSFLPFAERGDDIRFRELFHTPHGTDLAAVVQGVGAGYVQATSSTEIQQAVLGALDTGMPTVVEVPVAIADSVALHRGVDAAVLEALSAST